MLPVLERLIYKPRTSQVTRVLVLVPTRELGIQVHSVARQLAQFTSITTCLAVGEINSHHSLVQQMVLLLYRSLAPGSYLFPVSRGFGPEVSRSSIEGGARCSNSNTRSTH